MSALAADTAFLASLGVMDYSLLLGVDRQNRQLVVGIIDFVRQVGRLRLRVPCLVLVREIEGAVHGVRH